MRTLTVLILLSLFGCTPSLEDTKSLLEGYWEIEKVTLSDGTSKAYPYSGLVDFYTINKDNRGVKKKMQPQFSGRYNTTTDAVNFKITDSAGQIYLNFSNKNSKWREQLLQINNSRLKLKLENNLIYIYKRHQPLELNP